VVDPDTPVPSTVSETDRRGKLIFGKVQVVEVLADVEMAVDVEIRCAFVAKHRRARVANNKVTFVGNMINVCCGYYV